MQLVHDEKETTWADHGFVRIKNADGQLLAECANFQHNRQFRDLSSRAWTLAAEAMAAKGKVSVELVAKEKEMGAAMDLMDSVGKPSLQKRATFEDLMAPVGKHSPPRKASNRSGSQPHSRNQRARRSSLSQHGQQVLRSRVRSNSTSRVG